MRIVSLVAGLAVASSLTAQQPPPEGASLEGRILHVQTGEPVRRAKVTLGPQGSRSSTLAVLADAEGRFVFDRVPPGAYRLWA